MDALKRKLEKLIHKATTKISFKILIDENIPDAIDGFIKSNYIDLLSNLLRRYLYQKLLDYVTAIYQHSYLAFKRGWKIE